MEILAELRMAGDLTGASFGKVTCFDSPKPIHDLAAEIGPEVGAIPSSIPGMGGSSGELYRIGIHKAIGMRIALGHVGLDPADAVVVGDSHNDIEMIEDAGTGVAIEGADPAVLAVADRIAPGPEREGLVGLFAELGLY